MQPMPQPVSGRKNLTLWLMILGYVLVAAAGGIGIYRRNRIIEAQQLKLAESARENDELRRRLKELPAQPPEPQPAAPLEPNSRTPRPSDPSDALTVPEKNTRRLHESVM